MLGLYREALALRRRLPALGDGRLEWLTPGDHVLAFTRGPDFGCVVNLGRQPVDRPRELAGHRVLLGSAQDVADATIPGDTTVWYGQSNS
jgi:alpha-glucosidase